MSYPARIQALADAFLKGTGKSSLRQAVTDYAAKLTGANRQKVEIPDHLKTYAEKVTHHAYRVVDSDVEQLRTAGYSEDEILEITMGLALGAGLARVEIAYQALQGER